MEPINICSCLSDIQDVVNFSLCSKEYYEKMKNYIYRYKTQWDFMKSIDTYYVHDMLELLEMKILRKLYIPFKRYVKPGANVYQVLQAGTNRIFLEISSMDDLSVTFMDAQILCHIFHETKPDFRILL